MTPFPISRVDEKMLDFRDRPATIRLSPSSRSHNSKNVHRLSVPSGLGDTFPCMGSGGVQHGGCQ